MKRLLTWMCTIVLLVSLTSAVTAEETATSGYGYIDRNGNVIIAPQFDYAYSFSSSGLARVFSGSISSWGYPDEGVYGYIGKDGNMVIDSIYSEATDFNEIGTACVCKNGKYGVIDTTNSTVIGFDYDHISYHEQSETYKAFNGTLSYGSAGKGTYYILDKEGKEIFSMNADRLYQYEKVFEAQKNDKYALISLDGKELTPYSYYSFSSESATSVAYKTSSSGKYGYLDLQGNIIIEPQYDSTSTFVDGKAIVKKNGKYTLIDETGKVLASYKADYVSMSIKAGYTYAFEGTLTSYGSPDKGTYYLMDLDGNYVTSGFKAEDTYSIDSNGLWRIKQNGAWGALDMEGNIVFPFTECESLYTCGEDRYALKKGGMWALADTNGNLITEYVWDELSTSNSDLLPVYKASDEPDFRSVRWGMTEEEVRALEGKTPDYTGKLDGRNARYIGYDTTLMGNNVILAYYFGPDGLYEARYIWTETHSNDSMYITDYNNVKSQLTKKYGSPWYDNESWDTTSHKSYYSDDKGRALSYGYLTYETDYRTPRTSITMYMGADNYTVEFHIYYNSRNISAPAEDYSDQF